MVTGSERLPCVQMYGCNNQLVCNNDYQVLDLYITYSMTLIFKIDCTKQTVWQVYKLQLSTGTKHVQLLEDMDYTQSTLTYCFGVH